MTTDEELPCWALDAVRDLAPLLTKREAAGFLRRSVSTLDRAINVGALVAIQSGEKGSSRVLIPRLSLAHYLVQIKREQ